jgi:DNA-binding beta-propeller fold protein YncE
MRRLLIIFTVGILPCVGACGNNDEVIEDCLVAGDEDLDGQSDCDDADCAAFIACEPVLDGFDNPKSAVFDATTNAFYVSSTGNFFGVTAGDGFISKLDATTGEVTRRFINSLDSPTGLRVNGGTLFAADGANILAINLADATVTTIDASAVVSIGGFLNDLAIDPATGDLYASDTFGQAILLVPGGNGTPEIFLQDIALEAPTGLLVDGNTLFIASLGPDIDGNFQTSAPGQLQAINLDDPNKTLTPVSSTRLGALDGIEREGVNFLVTDLGGRLFEINLAADPSESLLIDGTAAGNGLFVDAAADLGLDPARRIIAVPQLSGTTVTFVDLDNLQ